MLEPSGPAAILPFVLSSFDTSLCISSVMVSGTKLKYMCGTTTAEVSLSSQLFVELLPIYRDLKAVKLSI